MNITVHELFASAFQHDDVLQWAIMIPPLPQDRSNRQNFRKQYLQDKDSECCGPEQASIKDVKSEILHKNWKIY